jgi:hypothetical protein
MNATALGLAIVLLATGISQAGDYYIYRDGAGRIWLSNEDPRNKDESAARRPDDVTIVKQYQWQDVTDEQLAASAAAERALAEANALRDVATNTKLLANEVDLAVAQLERLQPTQVNEPIIVVQTVRPRRFSPPLLTVRPPVTKGGDKHRR